MASTIHKKAPEELIKGNELERVQTYASILWRNDKEEKKDDDKEKEGGKQ